MVKSLFRSAMVVLLAVAIAGSLVSLSYSQDAPSGSLQGLREFLGATIAVQKRHSERLMDIPDVVGTAVGLTADGQPAIKVYTKAAAIAGIPDALDGVPVEVEITGEFFALPTAKKANSPAAKGQGGIDPKSRFSRPVPIGVSTGNEGECSAGTIGARVTKGTNVYALSNNHVYALENSASLGSDVLQPGRYDTNCSNDPNNSIGTLAAFEPIVFSSSANNKIDAAIALSSTDNLGNATPSNGYGTPRTAIVSASVGQAVQKYGRTSGLTKGQVTGINATLLVGYSSGTARFVDQIIVGSNKPFIKAGDSGSLLVTNSSRNPVGLLYAGNLSGTTAVANPINDVLIAFGVTIDGQ